MEEETDGTGKPEMDPENLGHSRLELQMVGKLLEYIRGINRGNFIIIIFHSTLLVYLVFFNDCVFTAPPYSCFGCGLGDQCVKHCV